MFWLNLRNQSSRYCFWIVSTRSKTKNAFKIRNKTNATDLALNHFDNFYSKIYGIHWQSIRLGLLSPKKYSCIVNNYVDYESIEIKLRQMGASNLRLVYEKNLRYINKKLERDKFFRSKMNRSLNDDSISNQTESDNEMSSLSETDELKNFFTDATDTELDNNAASMNLDLNEFVPVSELKYKEEIQDDSEYFGFYDMNYELPVTFQQQLTLEMPKKLNVYTFGRNDFSTFPPAEICPQANLFNYYFVDGASILPVLMLDIQPGDYVGDFCAAPGGKALLIHLMTIDGCHLFLNDSSLSRYERLRNVFNSFVPRKHQTNIAFNHLDACTIRKYNQFDKILVDVPCTNDRHSLFEPTNNIFSNKRLNERIQLPMKQMNILLEALNSVKVGGTVIYSTCSMSPIQNDGVVHMALKQIMETSNRSFNVVQFKESIRPFRALFRFDYQFKYGVQVLPHLCSNFGPMYISKLVRTN